MPYSKEIEKKVICALSESPVGLSITDISKICGITRITSTKHLLRLTNKGIAVEYPKPRMRLFVIKSDQNE